MGHTIQHSVDIQYLYANTKGADKQYRNNTMLLIQPPYNHFTKSHYFIAKRTVKRCTSESEVKTVYA